MRTSSKLAMSKVVRMEDDEPAEEAAAEEKPSVLDSLSGAPADVLEKMKGMTLMEAAELTKEAEKVFGLVDDDDDEAPAEE
jgi:hypothetical protein